MKKYTIVWNALKELSRYLGAEEKKIFQVFDIEAQKKQEQNRKEVKDETKNTSPKNNK